MEVTITHLHVGYRAIGGDGGAARARLDDLVRGPALNNLDIALQLAVADDDAVYVIRRIRSRLILPLHNRSSDDLARELGSHFASAVAHAIANQEGASDNVVRFPSQADYVARFAVDLLDNNAWGKWYYEPFTGFAADAPAQTLEAVLLRNREHLAAILMNLQARGALPRVLRALSTTAIDSLWAEGLQPRASGESWQPLFRAAAGLMESCGAALADREAEFRAWLDTLPALPNWRDTSSLTATVVSMLQLLARRHGGALQRREETDSVLANLDWLDAGELRAAIDRLIELPDILRAAIRCVVRLIDRLRLAPALPSTEEILGECVPAGCRGDDLAAAVTCVVRLLRARGYIDPGRPLPSEAEIRAVLAGTPELDAGRLAPMLLGALAPPQPVMSNRTPGATPVERELLADIRGLLRRKLVALEPGGRAANAIRIHAALLSEHPRWAAADVPATLVTSAIQRVLEDAPADTTAPAASSPEGVESACAGVFLLLRAVFDAQVPRLSASLAYPACEHPLPALLAALALRWSGNAGERDGRLDPAIVALAGADAPATLEALAGMWSTTTPADHTRFAHSLIAMLVSHRLIDGSEIHFSRPPAAAPILVASCERRDVWPLAAPESGPEISLRWTELFREVTGNQPAVFTETEPPPGWDAFHGGTLGIPEADLAIAAIANSLLRLWARWLRNFAGSSAAYLLENFVRRRGRLWTGQREITVRIQTGSLDVILEMAGYTRDIEPPIGSAARRVRFQWGE